MLWTHHLEVIVNDNAIRASRKELEVADVAPLEKKSDGAVTEREVRPARMATAEGLRRRPVVDDDRVVVREAEDPTERLDVGQLDAGAARDRDRHAGSGRAARVDRRDVVELREVAGAR